MDNALTRRALFDAWRSESNVSNRNYSVYTCVMNNLGLQDCDDHVTECVRKVSDSFCVHLKDRWQKSHHIVKIFLTKNAKWLDGVVEFPEIILNAAAIRKPGSPRDFSTPKTHLGRQKKLFVESSDKTKKRRLLPVVAQSTSEELVYAAQMSLCSKGKRDAAEIVKQIEESPMRATRIKKAYKSPEKPAPIKLTGDKALALYVDAKLTKNQYMLIRSQAKLQNANIYPSYHKVLEAKKKCYPDGIDITEISAEVKLQALLDHTIQRLSSSDSEILVDLEAGANLTMLFKWGCDGASGQSAYKQMYRTTTMGDETHDDAFLFVISLVPLQLKHNDEIKWENPRPSSTRYCRPIKILFKKETAELTRLEVSKVEEEIKVLSPTKITQEGKDIFVDHKMVMTMVDGKVCSVIAQQSFQRCYICGATPTEMNNLVRHASIPTDETKFVFGLSSLHSWIRCFECLLHISYRLEVQTWQVRKKDQENVHKRKTLIQDRFRKEMGLLVDIPKPGYGTSNDGNTARRFFYNPSMSSAITGVNKELIKRFAVLLKAIASGCEINLDTFELYAMDTAKLYVELYNWYYMPSSVHKLLIHGKDIVKSALLPIGQLSEEAQEARNKDCRRFRRDHARKTSRATNTEDLFNMLLITSDPLITKLRSLAPKKQEKFSDEVTSLLKNPSQQQEYTAEEEETTDEELSPISSSDEDF